MSMLGVGYNGAYVARHPLTRASLSGGGGGVGAVVDTLRTTDSSVILNAYGDNVLSATDTVNVSLHVNGDMSLNGKMHSVEHMTEEGYVVSDRNAKDQIAALERNLVDQLEPVSYVLKKKSPGDPDRPPTVGFIAQDVEELDPTLVTKTVDGRYALSYRAIGVHAVHAVKKLQEARKKQDRETEELRGVVQQLQSQLEALTAGSS